MHVSTILYAENDPVALTMYQRRLECEGFHMETAQDGMEALQSIAHHRPDLLMLDLMLPTLSGADVLRFVRADPGLSTLPVVIFSNAPKTEVPEEVTLDGPVRFLSKVDCPFPTLLETIHQVLGASHAEDSDPSIAADTAPTAKSLSSNKKEHHAAQAGPHLPDAPRKEPAEEFLKPASAEIGRIRQHCFSYIKSPDSPVGLDHLAKLRQCVHSLSRNAGQVPDAPIPLLTNALAGLLSDVSTRPANVTPSVLQTIAQAVDCLDLLAKSGKLALSEPIPKPKILAVDDDPVCNHVMASVLRRASFDAKCVQSPQAALELLRASHYDVVLMDIDMPIMNGFELCEKMRQLPHYKTTPVIFITAHNNFDNRKQSVLSGAHGFIAKPVAAFELALKITIRLLKPCEQSPVTPSESEPSLPAVFATLPPTPSADQPSQDEHQAATLVPPIAPPAAQEPFKHPLKTEVCSTVALPVAEPCAPGVLADLPQPTNPTEPSRDKNEPAAIVPAIAPPPPQEPLKHPLKTEVCSTVALPVAEPCAPSVLAETPQPPDSTKPSRDKDQPAAIVPPIDPPAVTESHLADTPTQSPPPQDQPGLDALPVNISLETNNKNDQYMQKGQNPAFDKVVTEVTRIIFGEENANELNMRLVRLALESAKIHELMKGPSAS
jgi:CheY-like chemotaxis protein